MSYPILKPNSSWFTPTVSTVTRTIITSINIVDSYTPSTTPTDSWDASVAQDGGIMCYVEGTTLTIAGNGSGKIMANEDASFMFSDINKTDYFDNVTTATGFNYLDTSNTTTMQEAFRICKKITRLDLNTFNTSNVTNIRSLFTQCNALTELLISNWDTGKVTDMYATFDRLSVITNIDIANWDTSKVESFEWTFNRCVKLKSVDVSKWNTSSVTTMRAMFQQCNVLESLDVSNWDTSNVTDMSFMFYANDGLTYLPLHNWDVSNVTAFDHTFAHSNNITFDVSKWKVTNKCTHFNAMFHSNAHKYLDVSGFDTSSAISMYSMFEANYYLEKIDGLQNFDTSNSCCFNEMFHNNYKLKELDLSSFDTRNADYGSKCRTDNGGDVSKCTSGMLGGLRSLEKITLGENFTFAGDGTAESSYYGALPTPSSTYIPNADGSWYTLDGTAYAPADIPNLVANTYCASMDIVNDVIWDRDSKKYMHFAAMKEYHKKAKAYIDNAIENTKTKVVEFSNNETITVEDNTEYIAVEEITNITLVYPDTKFICSLSFVLASQGDITITLPDSKYIGGVPTFGNGETWELNIKNGVVVGGLIE